MRNILLLNNYLSFSTFCSFLTVAIQQISQNPT